MAGENTPKHYELDGLGGYTSMQVIKAFLNTMGLTGYKAFLAGNIFKYVFRYPRKNGIQDLYKAKDYIERLIQSEEEDQEAAGATKQSEGS